MTGTENRNVLSYASPRPEERRHSVIGLLTPVCPVLLILYVCNAFGREGAFLLIATPVFTLAAVVEALIRRRRLALPFCVFIVSSAISAGILCWIMSD